MDSELWSILSDLLTRTVGHSVSTEIDHIRSAVPENSVHLQNIVSQLDPLLQHLEEIYRRKIFARILGDIAVWVEHIWHYAASCLRVCCNGDDSNDSVATVCRVALQQSWYTDTGSPALSDQVFSDSMKNSTSSRPVIYLSPAAPSHLRRWLSLNICCSDLLITVLPAEESCVLPTISITHFEKIIQNDIRLGRQPLLLIAYSGSTLTGSFDCLPTLARICHSNKIWLHVEGISFLRMALLDISLTNTNWMRTVNSINLELSRCLGLPRSVNILLMQSTMPESILLYLNVFPITTVAEEGEGETSSVSALTRSLPSPRLSDALLAWLSLRAQDGTHVARLRHADHLVDDEVLLPLRRSYFAKAHADWWQTMHALQRIKSLPSIEVFSSRQLPPENTPDGEVDTDNYFVKVLYENSAHCPLILFRYALSSFQGSSMETSASSLIDSPTSQVPVQMRPRSKSSASCTDINQTQQLDRRFLNSLNHWLANAVQFEHPKFSIKTHFLSSGNLVLRFSLLDSVNLMAITDEDIDTLVENINLNCTIMEATWREKSAFRELINCTPGLYYYNLPDWAGLGATFYLPHTYRCLLPDAGDMSPSEYQNQLSTALLRLPAKAAHHIADLNRELISRLRSHDYAFSSARVNFDAVPQVREALDSLVSVTTPRRAPGKNSNGDSNGLGIGSLRGNTVNGPAPIRKVQLHCLRFGLITPGTDISEMVQLVLRMANAVEEDSNYVNSLSEVVKRGIEEATLHMKEERTKIIREQGVLRQVPYLDRLINWWSPPVSTQIHGQMLNLSIGELVPTDSLLSISSPPSVQEHQSSGGDATKKADSSSSSSIWSWLLPFGGESAPKSEGGESTQPPS